MYIDVDEKKFQYDGQMSLQYHNNSGEMLPKVYFHLYFNAFQPGSMMDERLRSIVDPDRRMLHNIGTKDEPQLKSRIADLDPNHIGFQKIKRLMYHGREVAFKVDGTILEVTLPEAIQPGEIAHFNMEWTAQVPEQIRRSGRNSAEGIAFSMAQWYPKMAHFDQYGWHLDEYIGREFVAPFGNFDVTINIQQDYIVGASGVLQNPGSVKGYQRYAQLKPIDNKVAWHFKAENIHDFAWGADPKYVVDSAYTSSGTTIYTLHAPTDAENKDNWTQALALTVDFFDFCDDNFGKYPWPTYSIVQGGDGGMEYGTMTLVTGNRDIKSLVGVIYHEVAHSWYQHIFGINETVDEWFDEGFTSYIADLGMQHIFEQRGTLDSNPIIDAYRAYYGLAISGREEPMSLLADYYNTNYAYSNQAYNKGAVFAEQLGYIIGNQNLKKTFLEFYDKWKFKHPTPHDFKRVAEDISGINLKWYLNLFVNTTRTIDYGIEAVKNNEITIRNKSDLAMPLDILVEYTDGTKELFYIPLREMRGEKPIEDYAVYTGVKRSTLEDWFWTRPTYTFKTPKRPAKVWIDPTLRLADIRSKDNFYEVK